MVCWPACFPHQVELLQTAFTSLADAVLEELGEQLQLTGVPCPGCIATWKAVTTITMCTDSAHMRAPPLSSAHTDTLGTQRAKAQKEQAAHTQCLRELEDRVQVSHHNLAC